MRNKKYVIQAIVASVAMACALGTATTASAATAPLSADVNAASGFTHYTKDRITASTTVAFTPTVLIWQGGPVNSLTLRLNYAGGTTALTGNTTWTDTYATKNIVTNLALNTGFRVAACCYAASTGDRDWAGSLSY